MGNLRLKSAAVSDNPNLKAPKFNFSQYQVGQTYCNNPDIIDFVTDGKSLYVCRVPSVTTTKTNPAEQDGLLKLVSQGPQGPQGKKGDDGISGVTPKIDASFDDDQLRIRINGETKALSPSLTGPTWKPVLEDNILTWELTDDRYMPESIDLESLRPIQKSPLLLRTNSDNTKLSDEASGPANFIQWKYEGDPYWTNLISISELMNLALAGVSVWKATDGKWHFGHREVVRANYISDKNGRKIISNVRLGDVLFDAGELPFAESAGGNDYGTDIDLIWQKLAELEASMVKTVNHEGPDPDGNVDVETGGASLDGYATEAWVASHYQPKGNYLTEHQSLAGLVKGVRLNNGGVNSPDSQGIVNLTIGDGEQPIDTSDCVKSVTINGTTKTPVNGNVSFNISVGETSLFDVKIENGILKKTTDGVNWTAVGTVNGGTGDGLDVEQVKSLIEQTLAGLLDPLNEYDNGKTGHNYFIRINELNSILNSYATKEWVLDKLSGGDSGTITHISYRTFTIYKWYSVDAVPSTPVLPTSASWDGTSNGLTLVGNTNSWSDHPGNRPNDSTRLWMATITLQSDGTSSNDWNGPIDLTAYPGKDGSGVEFIYTLCVNEAAFKALATPQAVHDDGRDDDYPTHWTDQPQSIGTYSTADNIETFYNFVGDEEVLFRIEAASIRTSRNGEWGPYCKPFIWSMWGEDGIDGDGVEYVFFLADDDDVTISNNTYSLKSNLWPDNSWAYEYQAPNSGWKDDPTGVDSTNKYEFVSKRKYHVNPETRQGAWSNWSEPALWSIYKEGPVGPIGPDGVSITSQVRYYKASNQSTGVTAPNIDADPTLAANGSWLTTSNSMQLNENEPYLWFFERIIYSNGRKWQSDPVVIRYFNSAVNVDYQEIENNVLEAIGGDIDDLNERLSVIVDTNGDIITDGDNGLISVITNYTDSNQKSFADIIVDGKEADIKQWAGSIVEEGVGRTLTSVKNELDGIDGKITTAATQAKNDAVSAARTEWSAADATITSTVTNAKYVWVKNSNNTNPNDPEVVAYNGESSKSGYTKTLITDEMSALKQTSDAVSIIVGQDGQVSADLIISTINGGTAQIDANHIILNGETIATAIQAAEISADQITSGTINANRIAANSITADKLASGAIATDHLTTSLSGGSTVDISGGLIKIKDSEERVRIIIGQEVGDGTPVLKFYDNDGTSSQLGTMLYDLGPAGIRHFGDIVEMPEITAYKFRRFTTKPQVGASFDWQNDGTEATLYKYKDGRRIVRIGSNSGVEYWNPATNQYQSSHTTIDNQYIASADATVPVSTTGFYVIAPYLWTTYSGSVEQAMLLDVRTGETNFEGYIRVDCPDHAGVGTITTVYTRDEK